MFYEKNLTNTIRLRMTDKQFLFLLNLATDRGITVSALIRSIVDEYARSLKVVEALRNASNLNPYIEENERAGESFNGNAETDKHDLV